MNISVQIKAKIRHNHDSLVRDLQRETIKFVCDYLYQENIFDLDTIDMIVAERTRNEMARKLLRIMASETEEANDKFVEILAIEGVAPHLAETIRNTEIKDRADEMKETADISAGRQMQEWSVDDVCRWLEKLDMDPKVIACFREQKISGEILVSLKREEIVEFGPDIVFGDRVKLIKFRDEELIRESKRPRTTSSSNDPVETESTICVEDMFVSTSSRNFGSRTDSATAVTQNTYFLSESLAVDDLIEPVHRYLPGQKLDSAEFSREIIPFICACLNDRTNGTFHLGVDKDGKINGIVANIDDHQKLLSELIERCFSADQLAAVKNCVRPVRLVKVVQDAKCDTPHESDKLHLVEIDVVPSHSLCSDQAFFAKAPKWDANPDRKEYERTKVFRFQNGLQPVPISDETLAQFMESKSSLAKRRQEAENEHSKPKPQTSDLGKRLIRLLCPGGNSLDDDDVYPIFVMSSAPDSQSSAEDFIANTRFISSVERKAVFDFDDASAPTSMYRNHASTARVPTQVFVVPSSTAKAGKQQDESFVLSLQDCLNSESVCQPWIFCNGFTDINDKPMDLLDWNKARRGDFFKALDYVHKVCPRRRSIVVFLLFSESYKVLLDVAKDFCLKFKGNWMMICETQEVAAKYKDHFINTAEIVNEKEFNVRSIIEMPWLHVSQAILEIAGDRTTEEVCIPNSSGTTIGISREDLNELYDIEVIGSNHLSHMAHMDEDSFAKLDLEKEENFYRGKEVDWCNFWFKSHVIERDKLKEIVSCARNVLNGTCSHDTDEHVSVVVIEHQPGSGATTLAKNVLWELRTEYRCATLRTITNDTANQLCRLLRYGESSHCKPVLLLVDNFEKVPELKESLESEARKLTGKIQNHPTVAFVLLIVSRCTPDEGAFVPRATSFPQFSIGHSLSTVELQLFSKKFDDMERDSKNRKKRLNPRFLLSFNILRNNFSEDYIKRTVPELVRLVTDPNERRLLGYVAFVGVFDPDNNSIPAYCFDWLMSQGYLGATIVAGTSVDSVWLSKMSRYLKILVNDESRKDIALRMKSIRVIHSSLAQEIYTVLAGKKTVSEVCLEFLRSDIFSSLDSSEKNLNKIINNITVKRVKRIDGKNQTDFSLVVQAIRNIEEDDSSKIVEILKLAFRMTDNAYIAQHLARYYLSLKEWEMAETWARIATEREPNKEVLWNTYAHVYSDQFYQKFQDCPVNAATIEASLELAVKAMDIFRHEQYVNDREIGNNPTGLLYEGGMIVDLIKRFERIPGINEKEVRSFLVTSFVPQCFGSWNKSSLQIVNSLKFRAARIQAELEEDKYRQDKDRAFPSVMEYEAKRLQERMIKITESFTNYLGVESNEVPKHLLPEEAASYRRSRIFRLKGNTLSRILDLCWAKNIPQLQTIHSLADANIKPPYRSATDLQTFIGVSMALFFLSEDSHSGDGDRLLRRLTKLSQALMRLSTSSETNYTPLEPYMFFALFNWPTSSASKDQEQGVYQIKDVVAKWKEAYEVRNPVPSGKPQSSKRLRKILFLLGNGAGMNRIVLYKQGIEGLETFEGTLMNGGQEVMYVIKTEHREYCFEIETSAVENTKTRWNKKVHFEIGFTWAGPVACVILMGDVRRMRSKSEGVSQTNTIDRAAHPDSVPGFNTPGTRLEGPQAAIPYARQQSRSDGNLLSRVPHGTMFRPQLFPRMQSLPGAGNQPFPRGAMARAPRLTFNRPRNEPFFLAPPGYFDHRQVPPECQDGWPNLGPRYQGQR